MEKNPGIKLIVTFNWAFKGTVFVVHLMGQSSEITGKQSGINNQGHYNLAKAVEYENKTYCMFAKHEIWA